MFSWNITGNLPWKLTNFTVQCSYFYVWKIMRERVILYYIIFYYSVFKKNVDVLIVVVAVSFLLFYCSFCFLKIYSFSPLFSFFSRFFFYTCDFCRLMHYLVSSRCPIYLERLSTNLYSATSVLIHYFISLCLCITWFLQNIVLLY